MELDKDKIVNAVYDVAAKKSIQLDHGKWDVFVNPANNFGLNSSGNLYNQKDEIIGTIFFPMDILMYFKEYFKYNASQRIANKLTLEIKDGKVLDIVPSWDQSIVDNFYNNLPENKRESHVGWYDKP